MWSAGPGDDQARFLADLRALRDTAAIEVDELAARAHYPSGILKEAENGPLLPGLPILTAYVRACDGDVPDWEERWRRLTSEIPEDPALPVRAPGASPAAVAGARAGVGIAPPDVYDPERIRAALRGGHSRPDQSTPEVSRGASRRAKAATGWSSTPSWDAANGNHPATSWSREPFDIAPKPDPAEALEQSDQFHWLSESESVAAPQDSGQADNGRADAGQADNGRADAGQADAGRADAGQADAGQADAGQHQDGVLKAPERTDFWTTAVATPAADLQRPLAPPHPAQEQTYSQTSWSASARTGADTPAPAAATASAHPQLGAESTPSARPPAATQPRTPAGSFASAGSAASAGSRAAPAAGHEAANHQKDRFFPARLLIIIVIAALIGSALVLLLR